MKDRVYNDINHEMQLRKDGGSHEPRRELTLTQVFKDNADIMGVLEEIDITHRTQPLFWGLMPYPRKVNKDQLPLFILDIFQVMNSEKDGVISRLDALHLSFLHSETPELMEENARNGLHYLDNPLRLGSYPQNKTERLNMLVAAMHNKQPGTFHENNLLRLREAQKSVTLEEYSVLIAAGLEGFDLMGKWADLNELDLSFFNTFMKNTPLDVMELIDGTIFTDEILRDSGDSDNQPDT